MEPKTRLWSRSAAAVIGIGLLIASPRLVWKLQRPRTLNVAVVDKTSAVRYGEHESFMWLLRAMKIRGPAGTFLDPARDYIGFRPSERVGYDLTADKLADMDVLFVADTYGVSDADPEQNAPGRLRERLPAGYGGLSEQEADLIAGFAGRGGMVIAEFNTFAAPTAEPARTKLMSLFGVRWTKWAARYWPNMDNPNDVPAWVAHLYEQVSHNAYNFSGPALVFVHEDGDIAILRVGQEIFGSVVMQQSTPAGALLDVPDEGRFRGWMDVVEPAGGEVLAEHVVAVTASGQAELDRRHIPVRFPALVRRGNAFYFAGDFADAKLQLGDPERAGLLSFQRYTDGVSALSKEGTEYFFDWYAPILSHLLASRAR